MGFGTGQFTDRDDSYIKGDTDDTRVGNVGDQLKSHDRSANIKLILQLLTNANFLKLGDYTSVVPSFSGDNTYFDYYEIDARIARADLRYVSEADWDITLTRFINDADGEELLDDDDSFLNLD